MSKKGEASVINSQPDSSQPRSVEDSFVETTMLKNQGKSYEKKICAKY